MTVVTVAWDGGVRGAIAVADTLKPTSAAAIAEAADVFLERGAFDATQARRYLEACRDAGTTVVAPSARATRTGRAHVARSLPS